MASLNTDPVLALLRSRPGGDVATTAVQVDPGPRWARSLRSVATMVMLLIALPAVLLAFETMAPLTHRPSSLLGAAAGNVAYHTMKEQLEAEKARADALARTQQSLQTAILEEQAKVEQVRLAAQSQTEQEIELMRARARVVAEGYLALYQRQKVVVETSAKMIEQASALRLGVVRDQQAGRTAAVNLLDLIGEVARAVPNSSLAEDLQRRRSALATDTIDALDQATGRPLPRLTVEEWDKGLPDMALVVAMAQPNGAELRPQVQRAQPPTAAGMAAPPKPLYPR